MAGDEDLRVSIDWGDDDGSISQRGRKPIDWADLAADAPSSASGERAGRAPDAVDRPEAEPSRMFEPADEELFRPAPGDDAPPYADADADEPPAVSDVVSDDTGLLEPASLESLAAATANANRRIESLFTEAEKLRELTADRLSQFAAEVSAMSTVADELRATVGRETSTLRNVTGTLAELPGDLTRLVSTVTELSERVDGLADRFEASLDEVRRGLAESFTTALDELAGRLESRIQRTTADAVSRLRGSLDELEVNLRDGSGAGDRAELRDHLAEITDEIRLVKRRLALRAKTPPAVLADEQIDHIVKRVTAAVRAGMAASPAAATAPAAARSARRIGPAGKADDDATRKSVARRRRATTDDD